MRSKLYFAIFCLTLLIAGIFRFNNLSSVPPHPTLDEVSIGYNAYSLLLTGKDEFGEKFPVLLRAYDDWRPALYAYLVIPFVNFLGLTVTAVRLPSAILSFLSVLAVFFLAGQFIPGKFKNVISLFIMFLYAISPWNIYISRLGHEANAGLSFFIFALLFFFLFLNSNKKKKLDFVWLPLSAVFFALSFSSYQSEKIVVPLISIFLVLLFWKKLFTHKKILILSLILGIILILPIATSIFAPNALIRLSATSVFNMNHPLLGESIKRIELNNNSQTITQRIFDNRRLGAILLVSNAFMSHLNPAWLLTNEGRENFKIPDFGLISIPESLLIILGLIFLIRSREISLRIKLFFTIWLISSIIPGALTNDYPHAMRVLTVLPLPQIIAGFGFLYILEKFKNRISVWAVTILIFTAITLWLYHAYFTNFKREESYRFQYGIEDAFEKATKNEKEFYTILVSNQGVLRASYMYYLFFNKIDPNYYQNSGQNENGRFSTERRIGKYIFMNPEDRGSENFSILIIPAGSKPRKEIRIIEEINYLDKTPSIWIATGK